MRDIDIATELIKSPPNSSHFDEPGWRLVDVEKVLAEMTEKGIELSDALEVCHEAVELLGGRVLDSPLEAGLAPAQRESRAKEAWWIREDSVSGS